MERVWGYLKDGPKPAKEPIPEEFYSDPAGLARLWERIKNARPQIEDRAEAERRFRAQKLGSGVVRPNIANEQTDKT